MDQSKVPRMVVLLCKGRTSNRLDCRALAGARRYSIDSASAGSTCGGFSWDLPEFSRYISFDVLHGCKTWPSEAGNSLESIGAISYEYGGWLMRAEDLPHNRRMSLGALS
jgi:hypothetical protein